MARSLTSSSSQYFTASQVVSSYPFSVSMWVKPTDAASNYPLWFTYANANNLLGFSIRGDQAGDYVVCYAKDAGGSPTTCNTTTGITSGVWQHIAMVVASTSSRNIFLNGGGKGTSTVTESPTLNNQVMCTDGGTSAFFDGYLCEYARWNVALSDSEVLGLASGCSPLLVGSSPPVVYCPMGYSDTDEIGFQTWSPQNSPTFVDDYAPVTYVFISGSFEQPPQATQITVTSTATTGRNVYSPTVTPVPWQITQSDVPSSGRSVPSPVMSFVNYISNPDAIASSASVPSPVLSFVNYISAPDFISSSASVPDPSLSHVYNITANPAPSKKSIPDPTIIPGAVSISQSEVPSSGRSVPNPVINNTVVITQTSIAASSRSIPAPKVNMNLVVTSVPSSSRAVPDPTLTPGAVTISQSGVPSSGRAVPDPVVVAGSTLITQGDVASSARIVPSPTVTGRWSISVSSAAPSKKELYSPTLSFVNYIITDQIASNRNVPLPSVVGGDGGRSGGGWIWYRRGKK